MNEEEAAIVQLIYEKYLEEHSCKNIEAYLINMGIRTRKGVFFDDIAIRRILTNPVYCEVTEESLEYFRNLKCEVVCNSLWRETAVGFMPYNRTNTKRRLQSADKWLLSAGTHEPIVSGRDWRKTQNNIK